MAVYIYVYGWWTKPYFAWPLTTIYSDGTWTTDITTGGADQQATQIAAFLLPNGYTPPAMSGGQALPAELYTQAADYVIADRPAVLRTIQFSGYTWNVKQSDTPAGPGPNYFSDAESDVWVDGDGALHLKIAWRDGRWYCTEIINTVSLGYGSYEFTLASRVDQLDANAVLGLFTWDNTAPEFHYREIDIEFSRWGIPINQNAGYVVQPYDTSGNLHRFDFALADGVSRHSFNWQANGVQFISQQGETVLQSWNYTGGDVPPPGIENARLNLWLNNGVAPANGQEIEVVVNSFQFTP